MLYLITWTLKKYNTEKYIQNTMFGIQVEYLWKISWKKWEKNNQEQTFFLYPYLDDTSKTIKYFAFDTPEQKVMFQSALKISGVGPKTAFQIAHLELSTLQDAIKNLDYKVFEAIKWIWPKSAKKILFEMKGNIKIEEYQKLDIDEKLYKQIISALKALGYDKDLIREKLDTYPEKITKENRDEVIRTIIKEI